MLYEQAKTTLFCISGMLTTLGIIYIASASSYWSAVHYPSSLPFWVKQCVFACIAVFVVFSVRRVRLTKNLITILYRLGILVALIVWIPGLGIIRNGARVWVTLGGFYFQPAEFTKITTLLYTSALIYKKTSHWKIGVVILLPCALFMIQPDFGSTFLVVATCSALLFLSGISIRLILSGVVWGVCGTYDRTNNCQFRCCHRSIAGYGCNVTFYQLRRLVTRYMLDDYSTDYYTLYTRKGGGRMEKLIDIEDRIPALRRKRKRRMTFTFSILLFLFFTVLLLVLYLQSSISKIQQITVEGTYIVDEQQLLDASSLEIGQSLWSFRASAIEDLLVESPGIEQAEVSRKRWSEVVVTVSEYQPVAFRQTDDSLLLLENGEEMSAQFAGSLFGPALQKFDNKEVEQKLISELGKLTQQTRLLISEIASTPSASDPNLVTLYMNDGNTVIVSALDFSEKLSFYPSVLQQIPVGEKGIVDMEVGTFFESYSSIYGGEGEEVELDEQQENE